MASAQQLYDQIADLFVDFQENHEKFIFNQNKAAGRRAR